MRTQTDLVIELAEMKETIIVKTLQSFIDLDETTREYAAKIEQKDHEYYHHKMVVRQAKFNALYSLIEELELEERYQEFKENCDTIYDRRFN